jgi:hypothetical protein
MVKRWGSVVAVVLLAGCLYWQWVVDDRNYYTLYRDSGIDGGSSWRIHVASFDTNNGQNYNRENCDIARGLFQTQPGVKVIYWCEKGRYRK